MYTITQGAKKDKQLYTATKYLYANCDPNPHTDNGKQYKSFGRERQGDTSDYRCELRPGHYLINLNYLII